MESDCIISTYALCNSGYAKIKLAGKTVLHHRYVYACYNNVSLDSMHGLVVMHSCDTPRCINPKHLSLGSQQDNVDDRMRKGRQGDSANITIRYGNDSPNSKLTWEKVAQIRLLGRERHEDIAKLFGVSKSTITQIMAGRTWKVKPS